MCKNTGGNTDIQYSLEIIKLVAELTAKHVKQLYEKIGERKTKNIERGDGYSSYKEERDEEALKEFLQIDSLKALNNESKSDFIVVDEELEGVLKKCYSDNNAVLEASDYIHCPKCSYPLYNKAFEKTLGALCEIIKYFNSRSNDESNDDTLTEEKTDALLNIYHSALEIALDDLNKHKQGTPLTTKELEKLAEEIDEEEIIKNK